MMWEIRKECEKEWIILCTQQNYLCITIRPSYFNKFIGNGNIQRHTVCKLADQNQFIHLISKLFVTVRERASNQKSF